MLRKIHPWVLIFLLMNEIILINCDTTVHEYIIIGIITLFLCITSRSKKKVIATISRIPILFFTILLLGIFFHRPLTDDVRLLVDISLAIMCTVAVMNSINITRLLQSTTFLEKKLHVSGIVFFLYGLIHFSNTFFKKIKEQLTHIRYYKRSMLRIAPQIIIESIAQSLGTTNQISYQLGLVANIQGYIDFHRCDIFIPLIVTTQWILYFFLS